MTRETDEASSVTKPLGKAVDEITDALGAGNAAGALSAWYFLMNALGETYFDTLAMPKANYTAAADAARNALVATHALLPAGDEAQPARGLINSLLALLVELPTGKRRHPLHKGRCIPGTQSEGSIGQQHIVGDALAYVALLERLKHQSPVKFVADALCKAGYEAKRETVSSWKRRIDGWPISLQVRAARADQIDAANWDAKPILELETLIRGSLANAVASTLSDATEN